MDRAAARTPPHTKGAPVITPHPGRIWLQTTLEAAGVSFTLAVFDAWNSSPDASLFDIPWGRALSHGAYYAVGVVIYGVLGLGRDNGVWSWVRAAVAKEGEP